MVPNCTNYRAEDAIYDQLTNIYLEHHSAMELEDRGGALVFIIPENGAWKISGMEVKEMERIL